MSKSSYSVIQCSVHRFLPGPRWEAEIRAYNDRDRKWIALETWESEGELAVSPLLSEIGTTLEVFLQAFSTSTGIEQELPFP